MSHSIQQSAGMNGRQVCARLSLPYSTWLRWQRRGPQRPASAGSAWAEEARGRCPSTSCERRWSNYAMEGIAPVARPGFTGNTKTQSPAGNWPAMVSREREARKDHRRRTWKRITWKEPNLAWGI